MKLLGSIIAATGAIWLSNLISWQVSTAVGLIIIGNDMTTYTGIYRIAKAEILRLVSDKAINQYEKHKKD